MSEKPPFDPIKFACYLIAGVFAVQALVLLVASVTCLLHAETIITNPDIQCDPKDRLFQMMQNMMAAALALLAGFKTPPPPK